jgi:cytoskeletal protein RodZ
MGNKNFTTIIIVIATVILAGVAVFTAIKLYQTRQGTVAPNAPTSKPAAAEPSPTATACQALTFTLVSSTPTTTATATATATPTITASPVPQCGTSCTTNSDCPSSMICYVGVCRNPSCTTSTNCICATATPTATATATATSVVATTAPTATATLIAQGPTTTPTSTPQLPTAGVSAPTILGISAGAMFFVIGLILVL